MAGEYPKFVNGSEAQQMFAGLSGIDLEKYCVETKLKSWIGAYYGIYQYEDNKLNPTLLDKLKLVNMEARRQGSFGLLVSMITGDVVEISCFPSMVKDFDIAISFPQRTYFEKTVQEFSPGDCAFGLSACIQAHHRQRPDWKSDRIPFMELWGNVRSIFTGYDAYAREVNNLKGRVKLT